MFVVFANSLKEGRPVFRVAPGVWSLDLAEAEVLTGGKKERAAAAESAAVDYRLVVGAEAVDVVEEDGELRLADLRERIRLVGPTVRPDLTRTPAVVF